jgi:putative phosphoesterase
MKLGILSDTHDQIARTARAVTRLIDEGAEVLIHCGDLTGTGIVSECGRLPCYYVFGNNDFEEDRLRRAMELTGGTCLERGGVLSLQGRRVAVAHGDIPAEVNRLRALDPDYLLSGHSHVPADDRDGPTRRINPGALHRATDWTVALLDLADDSLRSLVIGEPKRTKKSRSG